ncbi:MAG: BatA domain-containing protein [Thermoguttaceae bacterium]
MFFQNPLAAFLFLLAVPYVWLYLVQPRKRSEVVSTLIFWKKALGGNNEEYLGSRLKKFWPLFLGLLFLALVTLAAMMPVVRTNTQIGNADSVTPNQSVTDENGSISTKPVKKVLFFGEKNQYLITALEFLPGFIFEEISQCPETVPDDAVLVIHKSNPAVTPKGNVFIIDPQNCSDFFSFEQTTTPEAVKPNGAAVNNKNKSDILRNVDFSGVVIYNDKKLNIKKPGQAIKILAVNVDGEPFYVCSETENPYTRLLILSADLSKGNFTQKTSFPILLANAIESLTRLQTENDTKNNIEPKEYPVWFWLVACAIAVYVIHCAVSTSRNFKPRDYHSL